LGNFSAGGIRSKIIATVIDDQDDVTRRGTCLLLFPSQASDVTAKYG